MVKDVIVVYQKPTCTTCRHVYNALKESGVAFDAVDYYVDPIPKAKLKELLRKMGIKARDLLHDLFLAELFGNVVNIDLYFRVGIILVGDKLAFVVLILVSDDIAHDLKGWILTCLDDDFLQVDNVF